MTAWMIDLSAFILLAVAESLTMFLQVLLNYSVILTLHINITGPRAIRLSIIHVAFRKALLIYGLRFKFNLIMSIDFKPVTGCCFIVTTKWTGVDKVF